MADGTVNMEEGTGQGFQVGPKDSVAREGIEVLKAKIEEIEDTAVSSGDFIDVLAKANSLETELGKKASAASVNTLTSQLAETGKEIVKENLKKIKMVAHRGLSTIYPENSDVAFVNCAKLGYTPELDILITSDNKWVIMHDDTVDRTTTGTGNVKDIPLTQLKELVVDITSTAYYPNAKVPSFEDLLNIIKEYDCMAFVEIKNTAATEDQVVDILNIIKKHNLSDRVVLLSFSQTVLLNVRKYNKTIATCLVGGMTEATLLFCTTNKIDIIGEQFPNITAEKVKMFHDQGILVNAWTVNNENWRVKMKDFGVDIITTDSLNGGGS